MNEAAWKRLLSQIRDGYVVPVVGPELLVGVGGRPPLQREVAARLLESKGSELDPDTLPPFGELNAAISALSQPGVDIQELYGEVDALIRELTADDAAIPPPIRQLAGIADFRLFVSLTPDDLLARALRKRCAVREIVHSPKLPTSDGRDLPPDWNTRSGEAYVLYLFGKSRSTPLFAIHDEDLLEYAHNIIARGSQVPAVFLRELLDRNLLLIGCRFSDWLSRFFLRLTSNDRLSMKAKREWIVGGLGTGDSLAGFVRSYSKGTELVSHIDPAAFVDRLYEKWDPGERVTTATAATPAAETPPEPLFFISYSRATDLMSAEALVQALLGLGVAESQIWFDRQSIEPGQDFRHRILDGIRGCRYFLPLLSAAANQREEAFVFSEWREANDRQRRMNRSFTFPVIVDAEYEPERYTAEPVRAWSDLDFGHAPAGLPDGRLLARLRALVRDARRPEHDRVTP